MANAIGTKEWLATTGGKLGFRDRLATIFHGVKARAASKKAYQSGRKFRSIEVDDILPPDTPICQEAIQLSKEASHPYLFNHCFRAYFWARLMNGEQKFDDEAVFTALMLHDLGLTDSYRLKGSDQQCFTLPASEIAEKLALKHKWSDKRALIVYNAISLHLNVIVDAKHGREAELVRMGSGADVAGIRMFQLEDDQISRVVEKFPRLDLKNQMQQALEIETTERPCCRVAFMNKKLGFGNLIQDSLFDE